MPKPHSTVVEGFYPKIENNIDEHYYHKYIVCAFGEEALIHLVKIISITYKQDLSIRN